MLAAQRHAPGGATRLLPFGFGALGLLGRPGEAPAAWPVWEAEDGSFVAFAGVPLERDGAADGPVGPGGPLVRGLRDGRDPAATHARLAALDGAFVAVHWDAPSGTLALVTDHLGMQPLYRVRSGEATGFASEVKAFARAGLVPAEPDAGAWGAMLYFGHQIGPRTLLAGVTRVEAAQRLVFTAPDAETATTHWAWPASQGLPDTPALRDAVGDAVRADVAAYAAGHPDAAILLSGGFDSRLILCLCRDLGLRPRALVQSHPDENADADARFATVFAQTLGLPVRRFPARRDFYSTPAYLRFLERNEVATPSLGLFIPNVAAAVEVAAADGERHGVWEGLLLDPALKFDYGAGGFADYVEKRTGERRRAYETAARRVFAPAWADQVAAEYEALLAAEGARYPDDAEGVWQFSVRNRSRFRTGVNPYQVYDTVTPPLTPGMSRRFWEAVAAADPRARFGKALYQAVFERLAPDGLRVPIASGNALLPGRGGAGLYQAQRARAAAQRLAQRPRVRGLLGRSGLPTPFVWAPSRLLDVALGKAALDDPRLNADGIRALRAGGAAGRTAADARALEALLYWQAWGHVMRGGFPAEWARVDHPA